MNDYFWYLVMFMSIFLIVFCFIWMLVLLWEVKQDKKELDDIFKWIDKSNRKRLKKDATN